jgi:alkylation response protein AidB-like acyl-CoA dehydrogenase
MRNSAIFQYLFAKADADVRAARAFLQTRANTVSVLAQRSALSDREHSAESSQAGVWVTTICAQAVEAFYSLAGGISLYDSSPLQRRMRDIHAASQHFQVQPRNYETIGRMLIGKGDN